MDTYTPAGGYTPQGQGVQSMSDTLSSITGRPAAAALASASQSGPSYGQTPIPQLQGEEEKLRAMFAHDQSLAAQYKNPNLYGGGATPPTGNSAGAFSSPLQATIESITNPQGMTDPGAMTSAIGADVSGQKSTLESLMGAMDFTGSRTLDAYKSMLGALSTLATQEGEDVRQEKQLKAQYGLGDTGVVDDWAEQVKGGLGLSSIPDAAMRNKVVSKLAEGGWTPDKISKNIEGKQTLAVMKSAKEAWDSSTSSGLPTGGPFGAYGLAKTVAGYSKAEPDVQTYLRYKNAIISTLRGLVGEKGVLSNQDMQRIQDLLPDYGLTSEQASKNWSNVRKLLVSQYGDEIVNKYFGEEVANSSTSSVFPKLQDPKSGKVYEYDSVGDPDYSKDLSNGFHPI